MNSKLPLKAFTLVELLVVITILTILSTIGFVVFSNYLIGTRDANRIEQLGAILSGLEVYNTKNKLPKPDNSVEVKANGLVIGYQGYMGKNNLGMIGYNKLGIDPKDEQYFTYYLTADKKRFQLMAYLEDENNKQFVENTKGLLSSTQGQLLISQVEAANYSKRFPKVVGKKLGILTESGTNLPIQEVYSIVSAGYLDVVTTTSSYNAFLTDTDIVSGTGKVLSFLKDSGGKSCYDIIVKDVSKIGKDGVYLINPTGLESFPVYCDMTTDGGGWIYWQGGKINNQTTDDEFINYYTNYGTFVDFNKFYRLDSTLRNTIKFTSSRTVHYGNDSQYKNISDYGFETTFTDTNSGKTLKNYKIYNSKFSNTPYEFKNCSFGAAYNGQIICGGSEESQNPWLQSGKVKDYGGGNYGIHTCIRLMKPDGTSGGGSCSEVTFSSELFDGACLGVQYRQNYITNPGCNFRNSSSNYYQWQEWVR